VEEVKRKGDRVYGVVVPFSCKDCMEWSYSMVARYYFPETYVILIPGNGTLKIVDCEFNDQELVDKLDIEKVNESDLLDVQMGMLKEACSDRINDLKVLPLVVPENVDCQKYVEQIVNLKKDIVVIICSEFTAYHNRFSYQKFENEEAIESQDMALVKFLLDFNSDEYMKYVIKNSVALSGRGAMVFGIEILKLLGASNSELLDYTRVFVKEGSIGCVSMVFTA